jgi:hypothetical protein
MTSLKIFVKPFCYKLLEFIYLEIMSFPSSMSPVFAVSLVRSLFCFLFKKCGNIKLYGDFGIKFYNFLNMIKTLLHFSTLHCRARP